MEVIEKLKGKENLNVYENVLECRTIYNESVNRYYLHIVTTTEVFNLDLTLTDFVNINNY